MPYNMFTLKNTYILKNFSIAFFNKIVRFTLTPPHINEIGETKVPNLFSKRYQFIRTVDKTNDYFLIVATTRILKINNLSQELIQIHSKHSHALKFTIGEEPDFINLWETRTEYELSREEFDELNKLFHDDKKEFTYFRR